LLLRYNFMHNRLGSMTFNPQQNNFPAPILPYLFLADERCSHEEQYHKSQKIQNLNFDLLYSTLHMPQ
jgi:hypothetical protein